MAQRVYLLSMPSLDNTYQNVIDFSSEGSRNTWFTNKSKKIVEGNFRTDTEQEQITLNTSYASIKPYDYCYITDTNGKYLFYFITGKSIRTEASCTIELELDVWTTYMFDFSLMDSFVERCHVNRWSGTQPTKELEKEPVVVGDLIINSHEELYKNENPGTLIVTNIPIGKINDRSQDTGGGGSGGGGGDTGGSPTDGIISAQGYRHIKGFEGFGAHPYKVAGESWFTAGYGITERFKPKYYDKLKPFPCSEQLASEVYGDMVIADFGKPIRDNLISKGVNVDLMPVNHFDVWVSLAMNAGVGGATNTEAYRWFCEGRPIEEVGDRLLTTLINPGTAVEPGLRERRKVERAMLVDDVYTFRPITTVNANGSFGPPVSDNNGNGFIPPIFGSLEGESGGGGGNALTDKIVGSAKKLIGKPYVFGGNYPPLGNSAGTDCSGLCQWAYNDNGRKISRTTYTQIKEGSEVYKASWRPADLIFTSFSGNGPEHVVLFDKWIDKDKGIFNCIEAPRTGLDIRQRQMTFDSKFRGRRLV